MKTFHSITPSFRLGYDLICITLAGIYTFQQFYTYVQNDDISEISFRKFTDDSSSENYPTYTICFEDQSQHHIYKTEVVKTTNPNTHSTQFKSKRCPCGCHVRREMNKLLLLNQSCADDYQNQNCSELQTATANPYPLPQLYDEHGNMNIIPGLDYMSGEDHSFPSWDYGLHSHAPSFPSDDHNDSMDDNIDPNLKNNNFSSYHDTFLPYDSNFSTHDSTFPMNDHNFSSYDTDLTSNDDEWLSNFPSWDYWESSPTSDKSVGIDFDLMGTYNHGMIVVSGRNKTYIVSPEQYKLLMLGFNKSFIYSYEDPSYNITMESINLAYADIDFNDATIDLEDFLLDFELKTENGLIYGWSSNDYKDKRTYCRAETDYAYGHELTEDCKAQRAFKKHLENRITPTHSLFKLQYQDPDRICYTPNLNPSVYRKTDQITLDLMKVAGLAKNYDQASSQMSTDLPFMKIYIHRQGQFMRGMHKEIASFTKRDLSTYCLRFPFLPIDIPIFHNEIGNCTGSKLSFDISQVTLLRSRHDSRKICNPNMKDEDSEIMKALMNDENLGCVPTYWKTFNMTSGYPECNETSQYGYVSNVTSNFTNYGEDGIIGKIRQRFDPPCEEMIIVTNKQVLRGREITKIHIENTDDCFGTYVDEDEISLYLDIQFNHANPVYQVINNGRSFSVESCWAGIGGFIGIFVGVSLRQIPELLSDFFNLVMKKIISSN